MCYRDQLAEQGSSIVGKVAWNEMTIKRDKCIQGREVLGPDLDWHLIVIQRMSHILSRMVDVSQYASLSSGEANKVRGRY